MKVNNPIKLKFPIIVNNRKEFNQAKKKLTLFNHRWPKIHVHKRYFPISLNEDITFDGFKYISITYL